MNKKDKVKKEVISKLKGERKLRCPFCNHDRFLRKETAYCDIWGREDSMIDENISDIDYEFFCAKCKKEVTEEELI